MAIDVTVTEKCGRCKRKAPITISSDKVGEYEAKEEADENNLASVASFVETMRADGKLPDLVVIFKGELKMTSNVCDAHCAKTVRNGIDTLFREAKPRKKKDKSAAADKSKDAAKEQPKPKKDDKGGTSPKK